MQPTAVSLGIGLTVTFLDLVTMMRASLDESSAGLWEVLKPQLLRYPSVVTSFEKAGMLEGRWNADGALVDIVYRGYGSDMTDIAAFLMRHKDGQS